MKKIRVLVVDDSPLMRSWLTGILREDPEIGEVFGARDPLEAKAIMLQNKPEVMTLDVEMPGMDGITFLREVMSYHPLPVVMVSAYTQENSRTTIQALSLGAVDFVPKPAKATQEAQKEFKEQVLTKVKEAATIRVLILPPRPFLKTEGVVRGHDRVIGMGASTGGTQALGFILSELPPAIPPIVLVQHMPPYFTKAFAQHLDQETRFKVREAETGVPIKAGEVWVSPGDQHCRVRRGLEGPYLFLDDGPRVNHHRPSVDVLFQSLAQSFGDRGIGVLLTGMGEDGAAGLLAMRKKRAYTIAQDKASSVIFGMPQAAITLGAVKEVAPLEKIPECILKGLGV